ncbi:MAG TPA: DUF5996 family protein [Ignavibacteria bacterium]|jgi:hypothetical protein
MNLEIIWPSLPYDEWKDTLEALHMKMQIVGKIKLELNPFLNQWWHVAFYLNASGMTTGLIPYKDFVFEINFDFIEHNLFIRTSDKHVKTISLMNCTVAEFYREFMDALYALEINVAINTLPAEVPNPIHCHEDTRSAYNKEYVYRWWQILLQSGKIFERFRSGFRGKGSPVHFYWGSFDLSETRYSGKTAMPPKQGGRIMQFAENEENYACGFWAGSVNYPKPAFYSYLYPSPKGIDGLKIKPQIASYNSKLGEFILDYEDVRKSESPDELILKFLNSTYEGSAKLAGWDIESLKAQIPD